MKSPIQNLIDWTNEMENSIASITYAEADFRLIKQLREKFESELENEKKVIADAYIQGAEDFSDLALNESDKTFGDEYYKQTFKEQIG